MNILWHRTLYRDRHFFAAFPSVVSLPDGDLLLAFRRAPDHRWMYGTTQEEDFHSVDHVHFRSHVAALRLDKDCTPKGDVAILPPHPEAGDQDANLFVLPSGRIIQYGFLWYPVPAESVRRLREEGVGINIQPEDGEGYLYWGSYTRFSDDGGVTWSAHTMMPTDDLGYDTPFSRPPGGAALRGRMIRKDDGTLIVAGYSGGLQGHDCAAVRLFSSADDGASWALNRDIVAMDAVHLHEPALARWPEGKITLFNRTAANEDQLVTVVSDDGGSSFQAPETVPIQGHPYDPLVLPDGRLFLVYGYRHDPMGVRARLVEKDQRIEDAPELVIRDDSPSKDTGYPSAVLLPGGRILVAYYISDEQGIRGIEGTLLELT